MSGTTGTPRTQSFLLTTEFQDGQITGSISPGDMRDFVVSTVPWDDPANASGLGAPALLRGSVNIAYSSGVTVGASQTLGTRQANATNMQAAITYAVTNGKFMELPEGIYEIDNTVGLTIPFVVVASNAVPPQWHGTRNSQIWQYHANAPVMTFGDTTNQGGAETTTLADATIDGMYLRHGGTTTPLAINTNAATASGSILHFASTTGVVVGQLVYNNSNPGSMPTNTIVTAATGTTVTIFPAVDSSVSSGDTIWFAGSNTLTLGASFSSSFKNIVLGDGIAIPWNALNILTRDTFNSAFFSNTLVDFRIPGAVNSYINNGMAGTGNKYINFYCSGGGTGLGIDSAPAATRYPLYLGTTSGNGSSEQTFDQLNIEGTSANSQVTLNGAITARFVPLHVEGFGLTGADPCVVSLSSGSMAYFNGGQWFSPFIQTGGSFTGTASIFKCFDENAVTADNILLDLGQGTVSAPFNLFYTDPGAAIATCVARNIRMSNLTGFFSPETALPLATYGHIEQMVDYHFSQVFPTMQKSGMIDQPTFTLFGAVGHIVTLIYSAVLAATVTITLSSKMMSSGSGSTIFRPVGDQVKVIRQSGAIGAFNIVVINGGAGAGTLKTFTGAASAGTSANFGFDGTNWALI